ncbi:MAG: MinD/ParA family protein [Candidatus Micrarchaeia archaeon]|jgi:MinD-like ATPase involved in chromosome partitioning or flagellar assembly
MVRIISIVAGKGGVGKSTVALNTAAALAGHYKRKVVLVDLNLTTPHLAAMTGIGPKAKVLEDVIIGNAGLAEALHSHESGMKVLASSISPRKFSYSELGKIGPMLRELKKSYDDVVIDCGPGLGTEAMLGMRYGDQLLYIATPTVPSLMDVIRCRKAVRSMGKKELGMVLNMVAKDEAQLTPYQASALTDIPVLCSIPRDRAVPKSQAAERTTLHYDYYSPASQEFLKLGAHLSGQQFTPKTRGFIASITYILRGKP